MSKTFVPRIYQKNAIDFILDNPRCALFAEVGLGKTASVLTALDHLHMAGIETKPALVVAPLRVARKTWDDETKKWDHLSGMTTSAIVGESPERFKAFHKDASIYTTNFENLPWLFDELNGSWPYGMVIVDESTRLARMRMSIRTSPNGKKFLSGQGAKRARALAKIAFSHREDRWVNLSGTPTLNGLHKLYGQLWPLDFGQRLGMSFEAFSNRWFKKGYDGFSLMPLPSAEAEIKDRIKDLCLSIRAEDYFDLKEPIRTTIKVKMPRNARSHYDDMKKKFFATVNGKGIEALNAASVSIKLLQMANGAIYENPETEDDEDPSSRAWQETHREKISVISELVEELNGQPLIVVYQFKSDLARLQLCFPLARDLKMVKDEEDFKAGKIDVLLAHPASCGHGIDGFQNVCNHIAFFGHWWDTELRDQIIGRIGPTRQLQAGFDRNVFIYDIVAEGTVDEDVLYRHETRCSVQDALMRALSHKE